METRRNPAVPLVGGESSRVEETASVSVCSEGPHHEFSAPIVYGEDRVTAEAIDEENQATYLGGNQPTRTRQ